ncbi:hypothetical protein [Fodinisporobacter ferrooxydans]
MRIGNNEQIKSCPKVIEYCINNLHPEISDKHLTIEPVTKFM